MQAGTYTFIYIHAIWCTSGRQKILTAISRKVLFPYIKQYAANKGIQLILVNGIEDHVHCLFKLMPTQTVAEVIKDLKTEMGNWLNDNKFLQQPVEWETDYSAYSVSPSTIDKAADYISKQEEYHKTKQLDEELSAFSKMVAQIP
jgi:putative transposase